MKTTTTKIKGTVRASDLTKLLAPYSSGWVALSADQQRVLGAGETLQEARERALARSEFAAIDAVFVKVIPPDQGYLPLCA
jgi:hypothetical protein